MPTPAAVDVDVDVDVEPRSEPGFADGLSRAAA